MIYFWQKGMFSIFCPFHISFPLFYLLIPFQHNRTLESVNVISIPTLSDPLLWNCRFWNHVSCLLLLVLFKCICNLLTRMHRNHKQINIKKWWQSSSISAKYWIGLERISMLKKNKITILICLYTIAFFCKAGWWICSIEKNVQASRKKFFIGIVDATTQREDI